jgi:ELWxxDGT repeat protein
MGARLVKDINPAGSSSPNELISINGLLFFSAELGATDAPESNSGVDDQDAEENVDDDIEAESPNPSTDIDTTRNGGVGLMRSDGSENGTTILKSFSSVTNLVQSGDKLYFIAGINNQYQLWSSDGTSRGTKQVKDLLSQRRPQLSARFI